MREIKTPRKLTSFVERFVKKSLKTVSFHKLNSGLSLIQIVLIGAVLQKLSWSDTLFV